MERVERAEDLDMPVLRAQGIVGVDGIILMSIVWSPPADSPPTTTAGSPPVAVSFFPFRFWLGFFGASSSRL